MNKIRFSQPKYVIPLIILPFLIGINWVLLDTLPDKSEPSNAAETLNEINPKIPEANLDKKELKDKFESFKQAFKHRRDYTAISELEDLKDKDKIDGESKYTEKEKHLIDSINNAIITGQKGDFLSEVEKRSKKYRPVKPSYQVNNTHYSKPKPKAAEKQELRLFKQQMLILDSLAKTPEQRQAEALAKQKQAALTALSEQNQLRRSKLVPVSKSTNHQDRFFNTVTLEHEDSYIRAILDEDLKVIKGSRIRIRIIEDIYVGEHLLERGTYLFAHVDAFSSQRIYITIQSILLKGQIVPVELVIYDNDGLEGLYVPASKFREFTKGLGSNLASGTNIGLGNNSPSQLSELLYGLSERGIRTTSRAAANTSRKNRTKLKFGSFIYLVSPDQLKN